MKIQIFKTLYLFICLSSCIPLLTSCVSWSTESPNHWNVKRISDSQIEQIEKFKKWCESPGALCYVPKDTPTQYVAHFWQFLDSFNEEPDGFGMYSYVLVGANKSDTASTNYDLLVQTIRGSTTESGSIPKDKDIDLSRFNLFMIPLLCKYNSEICESIITVSIENNDFSAVDDIMLPNHRLSKLLLSALSSSSPLSFDGPGPYIITVVNPISFGSSDIVNMFYIDLTNVHPAAYPEVVYAHKTLLFSSDLEGIKKLESLRLSLLYLALDLNDSIGFAKAAYAETKNIFTDTE